MDSIITYLIAYNQYLIFYLFPFKETNYTTKPIVFICPY